MKKFIINFIVVCALLLASCEREKVIFNESQVFVEFESLNVDLPIVIDATGSIEVAVTVSSATESERSINLEIVQAETTASADVYTVGSIVIPPNSYEGKLTIDGVDNNVTTQPEKLVLALPAGGDFSSDGNLTVNIFQVCPVDETFATGMYLLEGVTNELLFGSTILTPGTVFEVTADGLTRTFSTQEWGSFCFPADGWELHDFKLSLVCNEVGGTVSEYRL